MEKYLSKVQFNEMIEGQKTVFYVDKNLNIQARIPNAGYQYRGSRKECESYIELAKKKYSEEEKRANEDVWLEGRNFKESPRSDSWKAKKRKHDEERKKRRKERN